MSAERLTSPRVPSFYFIGVSTGGSQSRKAFPRWMKALGRPEVELVGIDLELHADPGEYRRVVEHIKREPLALGGLVTTHKIDLLAASRDLFDELGPHAKLIGEVSSIAKDDGHLVGRTVDPIAGGRSLDAILGPGYFGETRGWVLMLGAGGAAAALVLHLLDKAAAADRPERIVAVNRSPGRLERLRHLVAAHDTDIEFAYVQNDRQARNDELLGELPPGSVVINATGMGKDTAGSPISDAGVFPLDGVAWELNYRGTLEFLHQARAQREERRLTVEDGWVYFANGWIRVISDVLHTPIGAEMFAVLSQLAAGPAERR